jgi:predicted site-specific integrase-resolvase
MSSTLPLMLKDKAEETQEPSPVLVRARDIAEALSVSMRQVGYWAKDGRIPSHRLGRRCVRYSLPAVLKALNIKLNH